MTKRERGVFTTEFTRALLPLLMYMCLSEQTVRSASLPTSEDSAFTDFLLDKCPIVELPRQCPQPKDCTDILELGYTQSGVYTVYVGPYNQSVDVYCELDDQAGVGWLVFQRRLDGFTNFYRKWDDYANGFGNLRGEFWLGNHFLHLITKQKRYHLKVVLEDFNSETAFAEYTHFEVAAPYRKYELSVGGYTSDSTAGNSLSRQNGHEFSTYDKENDIHGTLHCAQYSYGAWWYEKCKDSNLNGKYRGGPFTGDKNNGVSWLTWRGHWYSLKTTIMMLRPL